MNRIERLIVLSTLLLALAGTIGLNLAAVEGPDGSLGGHIALYAVIGFIDLLWAAGIYAFFRVK